MSSRETAWAFRQSAGSPLKKLILIVLADVCHPDAPINIDLPWLAEQCEVGPLALNEALAELRGDGLLAVRRDGSVWLNVE